MIRICQTAVLVSDNNTNVFPIPLNFPFVFVDKVRWRIDYLLSFFLDWTAVVGATDFGSNFMCTLFFVLSLLINFSSTLSFMCTKQISYNNVFYCRKMLSSFFERYVIVVAYIPTDRR